jgi:hypothetical protein
LSTLFYPKPNDSLLPRSRSPQENEGDGFLSHTAFRDQLTNFYYEPVVTKLELAEDSDGNAVTSEDVEKVMELLRQMYDLDLGVWASRNEVRMTEKKREAMRQRSDATLAEVRRIVGRWEMNGQTNWSGQEREHIRGITEVLTRGLPQRRYGSQKQSDWDRTQGQHRWSQSQVSTV